VSEKVRKNCERLSFEPNGTKSFFVAETLKKREKLNVQAKKNSSEEKVSRIEEKLLFGEGVMREGGSERSKH